MQIIKRNWKAYNQLLVDCEKLTNYILPAAEKRRKDIIILNKGKVGRPYEYSMVEIFAAFALKSILKISYREVAGMISDYEKRINIRKSLDFRTIQWRIEKI
ncbi:MAG: hypothetical protein ACP5UN_03730, partial [Candidatus Micrarchaeia archaeon]